MASNLKKIILTSVFALAFLFSKAQYNDGHFADKDEIYNPGHYQKSVNTFTLNWDVHFSNSFKL